MSACLGTALERTHVIYQQILASGQILNTETVKREDGSPSSPLSSGGFVTGQNNLSLTQLSSVQKEQLWSGQASELISVRSILICSEIPKSHTRSFTDLYRTKVKL